MRIKLFRGKYYAVWSESGQTRRISLRTDRLDLAKQRLADLRHQPVGNSTADIFTAYTDDRRDRTSYPRMLDAWKRLKTHAPPPRPDYTNDIPVLH